MRIRTKITLLSLLITIFSISFLFLFIYFAMNKLLYSALDRDLYRLTSSVEKDVLEENYEGEYKKGKLEFTNIENYWLRVFDDKREVIESSPLAEKVDLPVRLNRISGKYFNFEVKTGRIVEFGIKPDSKGEVTFRVYVKRISGRVVKGWIVAALPIEKIEESQGNLLVIGILGIIFISFITAVLTFAFTKRVLKPLETIAAKAFHVGKDNLTEGIFGGSGKDEIGILSRTLNNMLLRLKKAFESQKRFISDASHELKTPISILRARWENELDNPEVSQDLKGKIAKDIEVLSKMSSMIDNLLMLSRTEEKGKNLRREFISLNGFLKDLIEDAKILTDLKKQELTYFGEEISLYGDKELLYRLFLNIMKNSVEYTPEEGKIEVCLKREENYAKIEIKDSGIGIPESELPHIFDRFFRVESSRSKTYGGSGLGLSIAKWIAEAHGGKIEVKSKVGKGTSVIVRLPIV